MIKTILSITAAVAVILWLPSCKNDNGKGELAHHHGHGHEHEVHNGNESDAAHKDNGSQDDIVLEPETAARFGVTTEPVTPSPFRDVIKVSGVIMPSTGRSGIIASPAAGIISFSRGIEQGANVGAGTVIATVKSTGISGGDPNLAAKATFDAARRELERIKPLYEDRLVTASEYNAALRAYEEASAAYSAKASTGAVTSPVKGVITSVDVAEGQFVQTGETVATVSSSDRLTLRADVPEKYYSRIASVNDAVVCLPYHDSAITLSETGGRRISRTEAAPVTPGYIPVYFSFDNDGSVIPGASVEVYLLGNAADNVISVPLSALSEQQGLMYVFVRLDEECYAKVPVKTGRSDGKRIEIITGLKGGEEVVATGTTTVRIAESSGVVPEGHSHNH